MNIKLVLMIIGAVLDLVGVIMIFDARILTKKLFSFGDQNEASMGIKLLGFVLVLVGAFMIFFNVG